MPSQNSTSEDCETSVNNKDKELNVALDNLCNDDIISNVMVCSSNLFHTYL